MSEKALKKAARMDFSRAGADAFGTRITMMLMADRADDDGRLVSPDDDALHSELAKETNAVIARLRGDFIVRSGVDNSRVTRVVDAMREADDEGS